MLAVVACAPKSVDPPSLIYEWDIDRMALPQASLRVMHVASSVFKESDAIHGGDKKKELTAPVSVYLYQHHTHGLVLIDAGFGTRTAASSEDYPGKFTSNQIGLQMGAPAVVQLQEAGFDPAEVRHIVMTHMHADHAGGIEDFPNATLWVNEREWDAAQKKKLVKNYHPIAYIAHEDVEKLKFSATENLQPYGAFDDHIDLFGDGGLILLPTPGHTPGHISVLVNLFGDSYLITGDTAWVDENWKGPTPKGWLARTILEDDWKKTVENAYRIRDWDQRYPELKIISGHEPDNIPGLPSFPETMR